MFETFVFQVRLLIVAVSGLEGLGGRVFSAALLWNCGTVERVMVATSSFTPIEGRRALEDDPPVVEAVAV